MQLQHSEKRGERKMKKTFNILDLVFGMNGIVVHLYFRHKYVFWFINKVKNFWEKSFIMLFII